MRILSVLEYLLMSKSSILHRLNSQGGIESATRYYFEKEINKIFSQKEDVCALSVSTGDGSWDYQLLKNFKNISKIISTDIIDSALDVQDVEMMKKLGNWEFVKLNKGENLPFRDNNFDLVYHFDVIEHVDNPYSFISEQYRVLKNNGYIIFGTPNLLRPANLVRMISGRLDFPRILGINNVYGDCLHIQEFTKWQLHTLLEEIGFKEIKIKEIYFGLPRIKLSRYPRSKMIKNFCHFLFVTAKKS